MGSFLDKAIGVFSPKAELKRAIARKGVEAINSGYGNYGANTHKKTLRGWMYGGGDAKRDIEDNIDTLRQRSRDTYMGVPLASAALKTMRTNTVAAGLTPTPQIDSEFLGLNAEETAQLQAQIVREWNLWAKNRLCDADRYDNFYQLQQLAFLNVLMSGDVLAVLPRKHENGMPYDLRVRLVEADRVCSPNQTDVLYPQEVMGHKVYRIVQGVETDADGALVAYWVCNSHPLAQDTNPGGMQWQRVEAFGKKTGNPHALHIMQRERPGQLRGVPMLAPVMESLKQLGRYSDAELNAAVIAACFTLFIQKKEEAEGVPFGEMLPPDMLIDTQDASSIEIAPGAVFDLNPGETVEQAQPARPNANFEAFYDAVTKEIAAGLEIPIEVIEKKFSTTYSAARGALNEFWRTCDMQRTWFADKFCQPVYETWMAEAVARGRLNAPGFFTDPAVCKAYSGCRWNGPARTNLNPVQEIAAAERRVEAGFSTAEQEAAQMTGGSYTANIRQRKIEAQQKVEVDIIGNQSKELPQQPK